MYSKSLMTFFLTLSAVLVGLFSIAIAAPVQIRDVFDPLILSPNAGTVWKVGQHRNVTWSTANAPVNITNKIGMVVLAKDGIMFDDAPGGLEDPLASGFDILLGTIEIVVPDVTPGHDYEIVLFGDSGNISHNFTILA